MSMHKGRISNLQYSVLGSEFQVKSIIRVSSSTFRAKAFACFLKHFPKLEPYFFGRVMSKHNRQFQANYLKYRFIVQSLRGQIIGRIYRRSASVMSYSYLYVFTLTLRLTPHATSKPFSRLISQGIFLLNENAVKLFWACPTI